MKGFNPLESDIKMKFGNILKLNAFSNERQIERIQFVTKTYKYPVGTLI